MLDINIQFNSDGQPYISKSERTWEPTRESMLRRVGVIKNLFKIEDFNFHCLVRHNPHWKEIAKKEIEKTFSCSERYGWIKDIQHIGSTAIPAISAKPMIDIMIGYDAYDATVNDNSIEELMYLLGFHKILGAFFIKKDFQLGICMHVTPHKFPVWNAKILFRDYLRENPEEAKRYESCKRESMRQNKDFKNYTNGKVPTIREILENAGATQEEIKAVCGGGEDVQTNH